MLLNFHAIDWMNIQIEQMIWETRSKCNLVFIYPNLPKVLFSGRGFSTKNVSRFSELYLSKRHAHNGFKSQTVQKLESLVFHNNPHFITDLSLIFSFWEREPSFFFLLHLFSQVPASCYSSQGRKEWGERREAGGEIECNKAPPWNVLCYELVQAGTSSSLPRVRS